MCFQSEGEFDHSPALITLHQNGRKGRKPFRYYTMWRTATQYKEVIRRAWSASIQGTTIFRVLMKLKNVKVALRELNKNGFHDLQAAEVQAYRRMIVLQEQMHQNQAENGLTQNAEEELQAVQEYKEKHRVYMGFLKQKAKVEWLKDGDENTRLFHQSIKARRVQNQIYSIFDEQGTCHEDNDKVIEAFVEYYKKLLRSTEQHKTSVLAEVVQTSPLCTEDHKAIMEAPYTAEEVKRVLFSMAW